MEYTAILAEIKKGHIRPVYLLYGEEPYLIKQVEKSLVDAVLTPEEQASSLTVLESDPSPGELVSLIESTPFFGGKNVIIVRDSSQMKGKKGGDESERETDGRLLRILENMPDYSLVVFTFYGKADKRRKLYKVIEKQGLAAELNPPKGKDIRQWVLNKLEALDKRMKPDALEYFLALLSMMPKVSIGLIYNELEKLALYIGDSHLIDKQQLTECMAMVPEVNVFEMTEALSRKEITPALRLLGAQLAAGEHPLKILGLLTFHVRRLWQVRDLAQQGYDAKAVAESLKMHPFIAERVLRQSKSFSRQQLKEAILQLATADRYFKSGRAGSALLEKIMIDLCA